MPNTEKRTFIDKMIAFESGEMQDPVEIIAFFQELIDDGVAEELRGSYGRIARILIEEGHCHPRVTQENPRS